MDDIEVQSLVGIDDVASAAKGEEHKRRGVAGHLFRLQSRRSLGR